MIHSFCQSEWRDTALEPWEEWDDQRAQLEKDVVDLRGVGVVAQGVKDIGGDGKCRVYLRFEAGCKRTPEQSEDKVSQAVFGL